MTEHAPVSERIASSEASPEDDAFMLSEIPVFNEMLLGLKNQLAELEQLPSHDQARLKELQEEIADLEEQIALRNEYAEFLESS